MKSETPLMVAIVALCLTIVAILGIDAWSRHVTEELYLEYGYTPVGTWVNIVEED